MTSELFTKTQQRVLGLLFGQPERAFRLSELIALADAGTGAVQREVARLVASGLVSMLVRDRQKTYKANESSPIFSELCSIVEKTGGIAERLRTTLAPIADDITLAILFGSVAKGTDNADSDIDILIVSDFDLAYNGAHAFALAGLRWHGYRSDNRYIVFQVLLHTVGMANEKWRVLDQAHKKRN